MKNNSKQPAQQWIELKEISPGDKVYAANLNDNQLMYGDQQQKGTQKNVKSGIQSNPKPKVESKVESKNTVQKQPDYKPQPTSNVQKQQPTSNVQKQQQPTQQRQQGISQQNSGRVQNPYNQQQNQQNQQRKNNNQSQQAQRSKIPMMKVACDSCTLQQNVPGNAQVYACSACNNINECYPLYGIFICGTCKAQVCYGFGTSQFIRCTRCGMVNKVPSEPVFKYKRNDKPQQKAPIRQVPSAQKQKRQEIIQVDKANLKPVIIPPVQQKMKVEQVDFFADQMPQMPQKPNQENYGEQLLKQEIKYDQFNDIVFTEENKTQKLTEENKTQKDQKNYYPQF